jgi:hypothetical protein
MLGVAAVLTVIAAAVAAPIAARTADLTQAAAYGTHAVYRSSAAYGPAGAYQYQPANRTQPAYPAHAARGSDSSAVDTMRTACARMRWYPVVILIGTILVSNLAALLVVFGGWLIVLLAAREHGEQYEESPDAAQS